MTDLTMTRGDTKRWRFTIEKEGTDPVQYMDLTGAVVKFAVKRRETDSNTDALIFLASYDPDQLEIVAPATDGQVIAKVETSDTMDDLSGDFCWDLEATRPDGLKSSAGSIAVQADSFIITGTGLDLDAIAVGDLLLPAGVAAENQIPVTVQEVGGSGSETDPGAGNLLTDYSGWVTESGIAIQVFKGDRKTPDGLSGTFTLKPSVVT